jgi:hypothetical protein
MQTDDQIKIVRLALDAIHWHIRKLVPIQEGRWVERNIKRRKT